MSTNRFDKMTEQEQARLRNAARKAGATSHPYLFFKNGGFVSGKGDEEVDVTGAEFVALVDLGTAGWSLFINKNLLDTVTVELLRDAMPSRPASMTDKSEWIDGKYGPEDPWRFSWELPIRDAERRILIFKAANELTRKLVGTLISDFVETRRRPIIKLAVKTIGASRIPVFEIIGHDDSDDEDALTKAPQRPGDGGAVSESSSATQSRRSNDDMNDGIPF
jgi:hypothetical protein